jgi:glycosyltransferase involved in cell wall biosynthesis
MNPTVSDSPLFSSSPADRRTMAGARGAIAQNRSEFSAIERAASDCDDPLEAVALARMAYEYAMYSHPGLLASAPLEQLLHDAGRRFVPGEEKGAAAAWRPGAPPAVASAGDVKRVLHIATEVYESGGHGRVLERWIEHDVQRIPTVLFLNGDHPVPDSVVRAVAARDGSFARITRSADMFGRARELRALAQRHDLVVLHIHNHEVLVALALADPFGRPPTILVNHSSHLMWAGVGCADVLVSFSDLEADLNVSRRGVPSQRSLVLPLPTAPKQLPARSDARAALGLDPDAPVLLSMGATYKLHPVFSLAYRELAQAALEALPDATLLLVGPRAEDGVLPPHPRLRVLGVLGDVSTVLAAADLLIDSWPLTGGTTVTDAGAAGLTVLALADPPRPMLSVPASALDGAVVRAADLDALRARLRELWASPETRSELARRARAAVEAQHSSGWPAAMERAVASAIEHRGAASPPTAGLSEPITEWEAVILAQRAFETQHSPLHEVYARNIALLPEQRRPQSVGEIAARIADARAHGPKPARAIAAPPVEREAIVRTLTRMRELIAAGVCVSAVILVPAELIDGAVALIEPAMAAGTEIDVELGVGEDPSAVARPGDVVLEQERDLVLEVDAG